MDASVARFGLRSARAAFAAALAFSAVQLLQIVKAVAFPWDAIAIYATSLCIAPPFVLAMVALDRAVPSGKRLFTHAGVIFSAMYATYVCLNYVVQLGTVIPAAVGGWVDEVRLLDQTPHSLFWDVDALGYIAMGAATLFAAQAFDAAGEHRWVRRWLLANAAVTPLIAVVYFYPTYSMNLLLLGVPWAITAPGAMLMLGRYFEAQLADNRRSSSRRREARPPQTCAYSSRQGHS